MTGFTHLRSNTNLDTHKAGFFRLAFDHMRREINELMIIESFEFGEYPERLIIDPYARNCEWCAPFTNDIDPDTKAVHHMDALDFLCSQESNKFHGVIFDPPFSEGQARRYEHGTANIYTTPGAIKMQMDEIRRILKPGGFLLKFGYNSSRHANFDLEHIYLVNHGGNHNDTIVSLWKKGYHQLEDFS